MKMKKTKQQMLKKHNSLKFQINIFARIFKATKQQQFDICCYAFFFQNQSGSQGDIRNIDRPYQSNAKMQQQQIFGPYF